MLKNTFLTFFFFYSLVSIGQQVNLVYPDNNHLQIQNDVHFVWSSISEADYYELSIATDISFTSETTYNVYSSDTLIELIPNIYYFRIRSSTDGFFGGWSFVRSFTILDILSFNPTIWLNSDSALVVDGSNLVEIWGDISGNNNDASQLTASAKPLLIEDVVDLNGKRALSFDGNDVLNTPNLGLLDVEIFVVVKGNEVNNKIFGFGEGYHVNFVNSSPILYLQGPNYMYFQGLQQTGVYQFQNVGYRDGTAVGATTFLSINGVNISQNGGFESGVFTLNNLSVGSGILNGLIAEVLVFDHHLNPSERYDVQKYIRSKYAPPVNLGQDITYSLCDIDLHAGERFTSYLWSTGETTENITVTESGKYWVDVVDVFGFTSSDTIIVSYPEIGTPDYNLFCPSTTKTWSADLGSDYTYEWNTLETTESIDIGVTGNYFVTVTDTNGCSRVSDVLFFDEDPFETTISLGPDLSLCSGNQIALTSGASDVVSYLWGGGQTTPSIVVNSTATYTVEVTNANGCVANDDVLVTIVGDAPVVQLGMNATYCQGEEFVFTDNSFTTDGSSITNWSWDFGDGIGTANTLSGNYAYTTFGSVTVELHVETDAGCANTGTLDLTVYQKPVIDFNTTGSCQSAVISFSSSQLPFVTNWQWNFDDPDSEELNTATGEITTHTFESAGNYDVELIALDLNGCRDTVVNSVTILPAPDVTFEFAEVCAGQTVNFVNQSTIADPYLISSVLWQLGPTASSVQFSPSRLFITPGLFDITLTVNGNNGCSRHLTQEMKVHALPQPDYSYSASCAGLPTVFTDESIVPDGSVSIVTWQFNATNPINGEIVSQTFLTEGTQQVRQLVVSDHGCQAVEISTIVVHPFLHANFSLNGDLILADVPVVFQNESIGATNVWWEIEGYYTGDELNPEITFSTDDIGATVEVWLIVQNSFGCSDTAHNTYTIYEAVTDLAITQLFSYTDADGFVTLGAELSNLGSSTLLGVDLFVRMNTQSPVKIAWNGTLKAGEKQVYIFPISPYQSVNTDNVNEQYICVEGRIVQPVNLEDQDLSNNELCRNVMEEEAILLNPFPNPATTQMSLRVIMPSARVVDIQIFDASGKLIHTVANQLALPKGLTEFTLDVSSWSQGTYTILLKGETDNKRVRFVKG